MDYRFHRRNIKRKKVSRKKFDESLAVCQICQTFTSEKLSYLSLLSGKYGGNIAIKFGEFILTKFFLAKRNLSKCDCISLSFCV